MKPTYRQWVLAIPGIVRIPIILLFFLAGVALGTYWCFTYSGLYRWLIEAQNSLLGRHLPVYTGLFTVVFTGLLGLAPAALFLFLLVKLGVFQVDGQTLAEKSDLEEARARAVEAWVKHNKGKVAGIVIGLIGVIMGSIFTIMGATSGSLQFVNLADLEAGKTPPSNYVQMSGRLLTDRMLSQTTQNLHKSFYIPVVSEKWREGNPVTVYVSVPSAQLDEVGRGPLKGMLSKNGLPGPLRTAFEESQKARPAQPHYLLTKGEPKSYVETGLLFLGIGLFSFLATAVVWIIQSRRGD